MSRRWNPRKCLTIGRRIQIAPDPPRSSSLDFYFHRNRFGHRFIIGIACRSDFDFHSVNAFFQSFSHLEFSALGTDLEVFLKALLSLLGCYIFVCQLTLCTTYFEKLSRFDDPGLFLELFVFDCGSPAAVFFVSKK